jgi:hypothetical protein
LRKEVSVLTTISLLLDCSSPNNIHRYAKKFSHLLIFFGFQFNNQQISI